MLCREIISFISRHTRIRKIHSEQNIEFLNVKPYGTYIKLKTMAFRSLILWFQKFFFSWGTAAQRGLYSWSCQITQNYAPQSVGLLWTSDQLVAETSTWQPTTFTTDIHTYSRWDSNSQSQQASGHWDRLTETLQKKNS